MTVIVCLFIRLLWLVCWVQGSHGFYIVWCLHLGPFPVLQRSTETTGCSVFKSLVCHLNEAFGAKKREKKNSTWKYHNVLSISSHSTGMFWEYVGSPFWIVIFPCVFSNCFLPTGHRGLLLREKRHEIDIIPLNAVHIYRKNTVIHRQCLQIKHSSRCLVLSITSYNLLFRLNLLINYFHLLKIVSFHLRPKKERIFFLSFRLFPHMDTFVLMVKYSGEGQHFIQINSVQIIHDWSHGVFAPYLQ